MPHDSAYSIANPNVVHETIDGETIILKLDTGVYYSLNDFGGEVWYLLGRGLSLGEIETRCVSGFDAPRDHIEQTVRELLAELEREELITVDGADGACVPGPIDIALEKAAQSGGRALRLPVMRKYEDMQDLLLIDPFHDVPEEGWPAKKEMFPTSADMPGAALAI